MDKKKIGKFIQELRKEKKLTQSELAELIGVTDKAISRWETGEGFPEITLLPQISIIFGVSVDEILDGEKKKKENENKSIALDLFKLHRSINLIIIWFGAIFSMFMFFLTGNILWSFIPYGACFIGALIYYLISHYKFVKKVAYNNNDKKVEEKSHLMILLSLILTTFMMLPIYVIRVEIDINGILLKAPLAFSSYWWIAILFMILGLCVYLIIIYHKSIIKKLRDFDKIIIIPILIVFIAFIMDYLSLTSYDYDDTIYFLMVLFIVYFLVTGVMKIISKQYFFASYAMLGIVLSLFTYMFVFNQEAFYIQFLWFIYVIPYMISIFKNKYQLFKSNILNHYMTFFIFNMIFITLTNMLYVLVSLKDLFLPTISFIVILVISLHYKNKDCLFDHKAV